MATSTILPYAKNGIPVVKGYKLNTSAPLDIRTVVSDFSDSTSRSQLPIYNVYLGMLIYSITEKVVYVCTVFPETPTKTMTANDCTWQKIEVKPDQSHSAEEAYNLAMTAKNLATAAVIKESEEYVINWDDLNT